MSELSHVDESGAVRMVDVGGKPEVGRRAVARAFVTTSVADRLRSLPKGDALVTAQIAGITAAKRTSDLIPLCHPLPLSHVDVAVRIVDGGVEMEALTAAAVAALTVYDMAKAVDREMSFSVELVEKVKE